jgi:hypothetical protein
MYARGIFSSSLRSILLHIRFHSRNVYVCLVENDDLGSNKKRSNEVKIAKIPSQIIPLAAFYVRFSISLPLTRHSLSRYLEQVFDYVAMLLSLFCGMPSIHAFMGGIRMFRGSIRS